MDKRKLEKLLFKAEILICLVAIILLLTSICILATCELRPIFRALLFLTSFYTFIPSMMFALRIEQLVGYYKCDKCQHKYVPTFKNVFLAPHIGRTRYMRCPECNKKSWNKKVLSEE